MSNKNTLYLLFVLLTSAHSIRSMEDRDEHGRTQLHLAVLAMEPGEVRELLSGGADADAKDINGHSPYDLAKSGLKQTQEMLRDAQAAGGRSRPYLGDCICPPPSAAEVAIEVEVFEEYAGQLQEIVDTLSASLEK